MPGIEGLLGVYRGPGGAPQPFYKWPMYDGPTFLI